MQNLRITSTASYHPPLNITNQQLSTIMDTSDEWIKTRTGIHQRYISNIENTSDLALNVGNQLLTNANLQATELDLIIISINTVANAPQPNIIKSIGLNIPNINIDFFELAGIKN